MPVDENERKALLTPHTNSSSSGDGNKFNFVNPGGPSEDEGDGRKEKLIEEEEMEGPEEEDDIEMGESATGDAVDEAEPSIVSGSRPPSSIMEEKAKVIYSEPSLMDTDPSTRFALSDTLLPKMHLRNFPFPSRRGRFSRDSGGGTGTPKDSICLSEASIAQSSVAAGRPGHKASFSAREIREQHMTMQNKYRPQKQKHCTDPVDFEGVLNIIGGCNWWQIWVYVFIATQQIPHAMFNLSVVYMMYQPEHWCQVEGFGNETVGNFSWSLEESLNSTIVYPSVPSSQDEGKHVHDQCYYFDRGINRYKELRSMPIEQAQKAADADKFVQKVKCTKWHYKKDVMHTTIVTDWDLVCDDNMKRGHAHLFYSFGYLIGCLLGGYASDSFGRKPTIIGFGVLASMFGVFLPYTQYFPMFLFIRFCAAVCNEAADLAAYVLCMEITGVRYRSMVGSMLQAPWAVGYVLLALLAYLTRSWKTIQIVAAALHFGSIFLICALPESPRWLMVIDRLGEAEQVIRRACRDPPFPFNYFRKNLGSLPADLELVQHRETNKWASANRKASIGAMFSEPMRQRTIIICTVFVATALVYYGVVIALSDLSAPGRVLFSGNFFLNNAVAGILEMPTLLGCVYLMRIGRRRSQMMTLFSAGVALFISVIALYYKHNITALAFLLAGKVCVQGAFNILYIFCSELYPTVIRNTAVGLNSMIARFGSGVSSYIAILSDVTAPMIPSIIFALFSLFAGLLVHLLPETGGKPLPETFEDAVTGLQPEEEEVVCCGFSFSSCRPLRKKSGGGEWSSLGEQREAVDECEMHETSVVAQPELRSFSQSVASSLPASSLPPEATPSTTGREDSLVTDLREVSIPEKLNEPFEE